MYANYWEIKESAYSRFLAERKAENPPPPLAARWLTGRRALTAAYAKAPFLVKSKGGNPLAGRVCQSLFSKTRKHGLKTLWVCRRGALLNPLAGWPLHKGWGFLV
jgi:hypothetical protein